MIAKQLYATGVLLVLAAAGFAQPAKTAEKSGMEITVYNQNLGLVKDRRTMTLQKGFNEIRLSDVAAQIDPTSVHFKSLTDPNGVSILEQNYEYDLISPQKLMEKYIGKEITVKIGEKQDTVLTGTLLSVQGDGLVIRTAEKIVIVPNASRLVEFPELPEGLISKPTLFWQVQADKGGEHQTELSYLTHGISWKADYVVVVNAKDTQTDLNGWVTLNNNSGAAYKDASVKLIAGDINLIQPEVREMMAARGGFVDSAAKAAPQFEEKSFFEYHMYTLQRKATIRENETKQIALLEAAGVPVQKVYVFEPTVRRTWNIRPGSNPETKVQVKLEFKNSKENHLGMPLPKGKVRVYKADTDGSLQFVGEDEIDHTPKDETLRLYVGDAFDLVGERKQMNVQQISDRVREETVEITFRNHKDEAVEIVAVEKLWGDWEILQSSVPHRKKDASTVEFPVKVDKDGEAKVTYRVRFKW
ncbi:MAG: hypothetical protein IT210_14415 [Armatimonadetes bacterium]|nr:hypothetical protein [Armatimonadota bacterium]